eukprot:scaffold29993_cov52-Phaeocystis_antarctica.AAC.2
MKSPNKLRSEQGGRAPPLAMTPSASACPVTGPPRERFPHPSERSHARRRGPPGSRRVRPRVRAECVNRQRSAARAERERHVQPRGRLRRPRRPRRRRRRPQRYRGTAPSPRPPRLAHAHAPIEQDEGNELQLASLMGRIGGAASEGPLRKSGGGLNSLLERLVMMSRRRPPPRRHTPKTFVGGVLLPLLAACVITYFIAKRFFPDAAAELLRHAFGSKPAVHAFALAEAAREASVRRGVALLA